VLAEPALASYVTSTILHHTRFEDALTYHLAKRIATRSFDSLDAREIIQKSFACDPAIAQAAEVDLQAIYERNPACNSHMEAFLFYKGYHALEVYRIAHWYWGAGRCDMALLLQSRISRRFSVDIHPAARLGKGILIDHASGVVIGETAVIDDDVSLLHGVTLGSIGTEDGQRHPQIASGALVSVGAMLIGNIKIGVEARIGAGALVQSDVPDNCSAVGVPARNIECGGGCPARNMDQITKEESD